MTSSRKAVEPSRPIAFYGKRKVPSVEHKLLAEIEKPELFLKSAYKWFKQHEWFIGLHVSQTRQVGTPSESDMVSQTPFRSRWASFRISLETRHVIADHNTEPTFVLCKERVLVLKQGLPVLFP